MPLLRYLEYQVVRERNPEGLKFSQRYPDDLA
jgi:hypothetical protein